MKQLKLLPPIVIVAIGIIATTIYFGLVSESIRKPAGPPPMKMLAGLADVGHEVDRDYRGALKIPLPHLVPAHQDRHGELYAITSKDGNFECRVGYVNALNSRQSTNSGEFEFFCRNRNTKFIPRFELIGNKTNEVYSKSDIALYSETLVDISQQAYLDTSGRFVPLHQLPGFSNGILRFFNRNNNKIYRFVSEFRKNGKVCPHTSVVDDFGRYFGSAPVGSYGAVINNRIVFEFENALYTSELEGPRWRCVELVGVKRLNGFGRSYGFFRQGTSFFAGGSGQDADVFRYDALIDTFIRTTKRNNFGENVTEYYSYISFAKSVHIGTYPSGYSVRVNPESSSIDYDLRLFGPQAGDRKKGIDYSLGLYRELQSVSRAYGILWGGMYPYGEVFMHDSFLHDRLSNVRLFPLPEKTTEFAPFYNATAAQAEKYCAGQFDYIDDLKKLRDTNGCPSGSADYLPRTWGLFGTAWAQRISQLVVSSGKMCASTGSMGASRYISGISVPSEQLYSYYGRVFCAIMPRHMLIQVESGTSDITLVIFTDRLGIITDGRVALSERFQDDGLFQEMKKGFGIRRM